ncbi:MAG: hypothetical protein EP343_09860 [Deltaproteobacteria bacterium]|nr:MAG: hypothetical protein EP343_09860 [Deltaproteobacteria bacterium]
MSNIFRTEFLGSQWGPWEDSHQIPVLPPEFEQELSTVSFLTAGEDELCFVFDPEAQEVTWCTWEGETWSDWQDSCKLPPPPNFYVEDDDIPAYFSMGTMDGDPAMFSYQAEDDTLFISFWDGRRFSHWEEVSPVEAPPNLSEASDVFAVGDEENTWLISIDLEEWSIFYCAWDGEVEAFSPWEDAPNLSLPEEWYDMGGIDVDGNSVDGALYIYATVYDIEDEFE